MEITVALLLSLLLVLVLAFATARRAAKARRRKILEERERQRRKKPKFEPRRMSDRTEMRAYDDPSTLAGDITTMGSPPTTTNDPHGTMVTAARAKPSSAGTSRSVTDKRSRAPGKPRA